jgi:N-acetyl-beta-hexosaminidase
MTDEKLKALIDALAAAGFKLLSFNPHDTNSGYFVLEIKDIPK